MKIGTVVITVTAKTWMTAVDMKAYVRWHLDNIGDCEVVNVEIHKKEKEK